MAKKDLRSFANKKSGKTMNPQQKVQADQLMKQAEQFKGKSDTELMARLMEEISKGKANGSINRETIQQFVAQVSPMMNAQQKNKLNEITKKLF